MNSMDALNFEIAENAKTVKELYNRMRKDKMLILKLESDIEYLQGRCKARLNCLFCPLKKKCVRRSKKYGQR